MEFWFGKDLQSVESIAERSALWFAGGEAFDRQIRDRFGDLPNRARQGQFDSWRQDAYSALALVLILDQFPRNLYRDTAKCFSYDALAYELAVSAVDSGFDRELGPLEATFLYLPFEHTESLEAQSRCVSLFRDLVERAPVTLRSQCDSFLDYAMRHQRVIERFGRFPHRNETLGRESTPEEIEFLKEPDSSF